MCSLPRGWHDGLPDRIGRVTGDREGHGLERCFIRDMEGCMDAARQRVVCTLAWHGIATRQHRERRPAECVKRVLAFHSSHVFVRQCSRVIFSITIIMVLNC
jgi:hypothetical protein